MTKQFTVKCPYGKKSLNELSLQQSVLTAKCSHGEVSVRPNVVQQKVWSRFEIDAELCCHNDMLVNLWAGNIFTYTTDESRI